jgi:polyisoprenoid-binding protein YceI
MGTRTKVLVVAVVALVGLGALGVWWFLRDDAPPEVTLEAAVEGVGPTTTESPDVPVTQGIEGTWTIDPGGDSDPAAGVGTFVGYRVNENLSGIGSAQAVGRTADVSGTITIEGTTLTEAGFEADLSTLRSDEDRRDGRVRSALGVDRFPTATFTLTQPVELGPAVADGEPVTVTATGDLTLQGVTNRVEVPLEAQLSQGTIVVVASVSITFADHGVEVPSAPIVLSADDHGIIEVQLLLTRP